MRYINADLLVDTIRKRQLMCGDLDTPTMETCIQMVQESPTELAPYPDGKLIYWVDETIVGSDVYKPAFRHFRCSECKLDLSDIYFGKTICFCPNCGVKFGERIEL